MSGRSHSDIPDTPGANASPPGRSHPDTPGAHANPPGRSHPGMTEFAARLDNWSDRLSPMLIKEVRQMVRGREFSYSFALALVAGLIVAFVGLASAGDITGTAGRPIFTALMVCLFVLGLVVVPLGAFNALRTERSDHTLDLITQTSLTPRRIVLGKLLTQGVKLLTLFAGLAPFVTMSFLLGGVDLLTILIGLALLFLWSMWVCALCLFVSAAAASRAVSGILFAMLTVAFLWVVGRLSYLWAPLLGLGPGLSVPGRGTLGWMIAGTTAFCFISMANLVLLAENRLSHPVEDRSTALRVGFFIQFLFLAICAAGPFLVHAAGYSAPDAIAGLGVLCGIQLTLVSIFATTEDMTLSRRVLRNIKPSLKRPWLAVFRPGGGRATTWVMIQILLLLGLGAFLTKTSSPDFRWLLALCGYICFFSGVPALVGRMIWKARVSTSYLRVGTLVFIPVVILSADFLQYFLKSKNTLALDYSPYHVLNPFRTLSNWREVESMGWDLRVFLMGVIGFLCYVLLIRIGQHETRNASILHTSN